MRQRPPHALSGARRRAVRRGSGECGRAPLTGAFSRVVGVAGRFVGLVAGQLAKIPGLFTTMVSRALGAASRLVGQLGAVGRNAVVALIEPLRGVGAKIADVFRAGIGFAGGVGRAIADWINANTPFGDRVSIGPVDFTIPALASGGTILSPGMVMVGERGPEILRLARGDQVIPTAHALGARVEPLMPNAPTMSRVAPVMPKVPAMQRVALADGGSGAAGGEIVVQNHNRIVLEVSGRTLAEVISEEVSREVRRRA